MENNKFNHNIIGLINDYPVIYNQAAKVIQYLYWNKNTKVKELTIEKFVKGIDENYYEPTESGDIDYTISGKCDWDIFNNNDNIHKCVNIIKNGKIELFDPILEHLYELRNKVPTVWIESTFKNILNSQYKNHIIVGINTKEEQKFIKDNGGLLIELPTNNPELEFQEKYLKTILKKFNNL